MTGGFSMETPRCRECGKLLEKRNVSGFCRPHATAHIMSDPANRAKVSDSRRKMFMANPEAREAQAERTRAMRSLPQSRAARGRNLVGGELGQRGNAARPKGSAARMKAGARVSATKLAWCPPHLRSLYRDLSQGKRMKAAEAREIVLAQHEVDLARWRQEHGYVKGEPAYNYLTTDEWGRVSELPRSNGEAA